MTFTGELVSSATSVAMVLAAMVVVALVEVALPLHARGARARAHVGPNLSLTAIALVTNVVLNAALVLALDWLARRGLGLLPALAVPSIVGVGIVVVALDFSTWLAHVSMHRVPALWRVHRVHHCDSFLDVTTTIRQHPGESLLRFVAIAVGAIALGASPAALVVYRVSSVLVAILEHANIRLPRRADDLLSIAITSPDMHKVHHSRDANETDSNYGNIFSVFDRLFGTFTPARRGPHVAYGLDGCDEPETTGGLLRLPFVAESSQRASNSISTSSPVFASSHARSAPSLTAQRPSTRSASVGVEAR